MQFFHHPLCPKSRFIRLILGEYGLDIIPVEERVWERRDAFLRMNPAGTLPVLLDQDGQAFCGTRVLAEFLDETQGAYMETRRLMPTDAYQRAEIRRLVDWFIDKTCDEAVSYIVHEKVYKQQMRPHEGGGSPDTGILRVARTNLRHHLAYIGYLFEQRNWLGGSHISYADLAAAAVLSVADYLGEVPWDDEPQAKEWYARLKSRPAFRPLLQDKLVGIPPVNTYTDLDF